MKNNIHIKITVNGREIKNVYSFEFENNSLTIHHRPYEDSYASVTSKYDLSKYTIAIYFTNTLELEKENKDKDSGISPIINPKFDDIKDMFE